MNRTGKSSNFHDILKSDEMNKSNISSIMKQHSHVSRSSAKSSIKKKPSFTDQLKRIEA